MREDYFGEGLDNSKFFSIPVNIDGGSGPNLGRFGTVGRNTFRGPAHILHGITFTLEAGEIDILQAYERLRQPRP